MRSTPTFSTLRGGQDDLEVGKPVVDAREHQADELRPDLVWPSDPKAGEAEVHLGQELMNKLKWFLRRAHRSLQPVLSRPDNGGARNSGLSSRAKMREFVIGGAR
jgi:hypothetical protein